jgi:uncharacterized protein
VTRHADGGRAIRVAETPFADLPPYAAWQHGDSRRGFEVVFLSQAPHHRAEGAAAAVEGEEPLTVRYLITFDEGWITHGALVAGRSASGRHAVKLEADADRRWRVDGERAPQIEGCFDVDLEFSCLTNAFPVHRLGLGVGQATDAPAAYVRAVDLRVERLEQRYTRLDDVDGRQRYHYSAPAFDFECELVYDRAGLLLDYPGIGWRVA